MRVFTTMSLTHSNGYVVYNTGVSTPGHDHDHYWYDFWDANLGKPAGPKAQQYPNVDGLFIREFTNGWAVYNRSGKAKPSRCRRLLPPSPIGETTLRPKPICFLTLMAKSISQPKVSLMSMAMGKSTSWI